MNKWYYGSNSKTEPVECTPMGDEYYTPFLSSTEKLLPRGNMGVSELVIRVPAKAMRTKLWAYLQYENDLDVQLIHLRRKYHRERAILEQKLALALTTTKS